MSKRREFTEEEIKEIVEYYKAHSLKDTGAYFNISGSSISKCLEKCGIKKRTKQESYQIGLRTFKERYGVSNTFQLDSTKKKIQNTSLERYGVLNPGQSKEAKEKRNQTKLKRYGDLNYNNRETAEQTCLKKYGSSVYLRSSKAKDRIKEIFLERYGVENPFQAEEVKEKIKQTCLERYGATHFSKSQKYQDLLNQKPQDERDLSKQKEYETKRKNGTFNTSKPEDLYYEYLLSMHSEDNIIRQYRSDLYPFSCDFYIPSEDLYIECNYSWTHGGHPFNEDNEEDRALLESWKEKSLTSDYYKNAIYTWTDLDVRKQKIARENKLNYLVLYQEQK